MYHHFRIPIVVVAVLTVPGWRPRRSRRRLPAAQVGQRAFRSPIRWRARRRPEAAILCPGQTFPNPGTCRAGTLDSNHSESWIAVKPGTEDLVGSSKFFFENYSKFYDFNLGSYRILPGQPIGNNQVQGYDCVSTGTQAMPPSWTNVTDPNVAFDTKGRVYQTTLPFNAFWGGSTLHPDGAIDVSYSDDMGRHWGQGQRRAGPGAVSERLGQAGRSCRGQAVDRGQRHRRQPQPGPRLRDVVSLQ
jgi:hypothetical protein